METMTLIADDGQKTIVKIERETKKAILFKGNASKAWFPKAAIDSEGRVAKWFRYGLTHSFLWIAPYNPRKEINN